MRSKLIQQNILRVDFCLYYLIREMFSENPNVSCSTRFIAFLSHFTTNEMFAVKT